MPSPDPGTVLWLAGGLGTAVVIVGKIAWENMQKRVDENAGLLGKKADAEEVNRLRDNQARLFELIRDHEAEDRHRHDQLVEKINDGHNRILEKLDERRRTQR